MWWEKEAASWQRCHCLLLLQWSLVTHTAGRRQRETVKARCRGTWAIKSSYTVGEASCPGCSNAGRPRAEVRHIGKGRCSTENLNQNFHLFQGRTVIILIKWLESVFFLSFCQQIPWKYQNQNNVRWSPNTFQPCPTHWIRCSFAQFYSNKKNTLCHL